MIINNSLGKKYRFFTHPFPLNINRKLCLSQDAMRADVLHVSRHKLHNQAVCCRRSYFSLKFSWSFRSLPLFVLKLFSININFFSFNKNRVISLSQNESLDRNDLARHRYLLCIKSFKLLECGWRTHLHRNFILYYR